MAGWARRSSPRCRRWRSPPGRSTSARASPTPTGRAVVPEAAVDAIMAGRGNQYPPGPGVPELRRAIAAHQQRFYGLDVDPDTEVLVTAGATEAIAAALLALVEPGDEVIAFEPYYDSYAACIALAGAVRVPVTLRPPGFRPGPRRAARRDHPAHPADPAQHPAQPDRRGLQPRRARPRSPSWPSSTTCSWSPTRCTSTWCSTASTCRSRRCPGMRERTVTISSAGKTFSFTGWKIGWVTAPARAGGRGPHGQAVPHLRQRRAVPVRDRRGPGPAGRATSRGCTARPAGQARPALRGPGRGRVRRSTGPRATYFVTTDISALGRDRRDRVLPRTCRERAGVVAIPSAVFYDDAEAGRAAGAVRVLQAARGAGGGADPAGQGSAGRLTAGNRQPQDLFETDGSLAGRHGRPQRVSDQLLFR